VNEKMNHQELARNETIERYVRHELPADERLAFQEHYFACDECFEQVQMTARFIAGVRDAARNGALAAERPEQARAAAAGLFNYGWIFQWATPALAVSLLVALAVIGWWSWSARRQNQQLAQQTAAHNQATQELQRSQARIRELEASGTASQAEKEALQQEIKRLKDQVAAAERQRGDRLAQVRQPDTNLPAINIYPVGDAQRSGGTSEVNQLRLPPGTRKFVLLLSDFQPGLANYRLEIMNSSGQMITRRDGLKPDRNGEIVVTLNRSLLSQGNYRLKLFGQGKLIAEYVVQLS
jgi:hypothetical protein